MLSPTIVEWIRATWLGEIVRGVSWLFPAFETMHFIGLCMLVGAMTVVDLRLLGVIRSGSLHTVLKLVTVAIAGLAVNLVSGVAFFASDPANYNANPVFWIKMGLVALAGLNVLWFEYSERKPLGLLPEGADTPMHTKVVAGLSLLLWLCVIVAGRYLPLFGIG